MKKTYEIVATDKVVFIPLGNSEKPKICEVVDTVDSFATALVLCNLVSLEKGLPMGSDERSLLRAVEDGLIDLGD